MHNFNTRTNQYSTEAYLFTSVNDILLWNLFDISQSSIGLSNMDTIAIYIIFLWERASVFLLRFSAKQGKSW